MKDVCPSWPHILPPRIQWHRRPSMMDAELMRQGRVWPSDSHGCSVCRGRGGSLITWKRLWMDKCVFGGMVSKGRKRIEKRDGYCVWFSRLPVEIGLQLPYGLEKQFLSNSFIIKEKDPFVNNTLYLSHVFLQRSYKCFRDFIFIKNWWVGVKTAPLSLIQSVCLQSSHFWWWWLTWVGLRSPLQWLPYARVQQSPFPPRILQCLLFASASQPECWPSCLKLRGLYSKELRVFHGSHGPWK